MFERTLLPAALACEFASLAAAEPLGTYFDRTAVPHEMQRLVDNGWEVHQVGPRFHYKCLRCEAEVEAVLEMAPLPDVLALSTFAADFQRSRKKQCAALVISGVGRCVDTTAISLHMGIVTGFRSETILGAARHIHQVFVTRDFDMGPVRISSDVWTDKDAQFPEGITQALKRYMLMLTPFY